MKNLKGKYAIVTGAGKGIGRGIVEKFLEEEIAGVAIFEWDVELAQATAKELDPTGKRVIAVKCDVSNREQVAAGVQKVVETFGTVDILVNNAGITRDKMFWRMTDEMWDAVINVNLNGTYNMCHAVVPIMKEKQYGRIVNISSTSAYGNIGQANYAASKAAVQGLTKTIGKELCKFHITVNSISPGGVATDMLKGIPQEKYDALAATYPIGRFGLPEELGAAVCFLVSDECEFLTAQNINVCGGKFTN